jgi:hypothetical protein
MKIARAILKTRMSFHKVKRRPVGKDFLFANFLSKMWGEVKMLTFLFSIFISAAFAFEQHPCETQLYSSASAVFMSSYSTERGEATKVGRLKTIDKSHFQIAYTITHLDRRRETATYEISLDAKCVVHSVVKI